MPTKPQPTDPKPAKATLESLQADLRQVEKEHAEVLATAKELANSQLKLKQAIEAAEKAAADTE